MSTLLQISDPHFGTEQAPVVEALLRLAREQQPDVVVLSGDVTQRARRPQFDAARVFIDRLAPKSLLAVPGNHDIPLYNLAARVFWPYAGYRRAFGDVLEPEYESEALLVVALNTTRPRRRKDGELSPAQIERAAARFSAAREGQLRIAVVHQPVAVTDPDDLKNLLHNRAEAITRWSHSGCDLILGGHIHLPFVVDLRGRGATAGRPMWAVQAGTAVSSRVRDRQPNSVNLIRHDAAVPGECRIEQWDWVAESGAFRCVRATPLALGHGAAHT